MRRRRVKITGIGPVTPAGIGRDEFWRGILEPVSRVRPFTLLGKQYGPFVAAYIDKINISRYLDPATLPKGIARQSLFAVIGAKLALEDAGITQEELSKSRVATVTGSAVMDFGGIITSIDGVRERGARGARNRVLTTTGIGSSASAVSGLFGLTNRTLALSNQCISGLDAIGYASEMVATGEVDMAICGGTEAPLHRFPLVELRSAGLTPATTDMAERLSRPFDLWRTTGVVSEGACMMILEPESSRRRGYSYIGGYACANDEPDDFCGGMASAAKAALGSARIREREIDVLNAWAPGHKEVDKGEAKAMRSLFGDALSRITAVSIKGAIGMPLGAAPAIQVASAVLSQRYSMVPPTVNWTHPDPDCPLKLSNHAVHLEHNHTLINAHGFGDVNSSMVLVRCP